MDGPPVRRWMQLRYQVERGGRSYWEAANRDRDRRDLRRCAPRAGLPRCACSRRRKETHRAEGVRLALLVRLPVGELSIRVRGIYCMKGTFVTTCLQVGVSR